MEFAPTKYVLGFLFRDKLLEDYVQAERQMGHTFRKDFPIEKVQQAIAAGEEWGPASDWVM